MDTNEELLLREKKFNQKIDRLIREYWEGWGYQIHSVVRLRNDPIKYWCVETNLRNGLPWNWSRPLLQSEIDE